MNTTSRIPPAWRTILLITAPVFLIAYAYLLFLGEWQSIALMLHNTGLAFGYVFHRTRNLVAPTVALVMINVMGQSFG